MADAWTGKLDVYLDGELPESEISGLNAHVRSCPDCAAEILGRLQLKRSVQNAGRRHVPSAEFRQQIQKMAGARVTPVRWSWAAGLALAAAVLVVAFASMRLGNANLQQHHTYSELADLHVSTLASSTPVDVISTDRHTVKPWFEGKIPFTFNLPELQGSDFVLVGGRMAYLEQTAGAQLIYGLHKHRISVFIFPARSVPQAWSSTARSDKESTFDLETWSQDGLRYFVIGDAGPEAAGKLAQLFREIPRS